MIRKQIQFWAKPIPHRNKKNKKYNKKKEIKLRETKRLQEKKTRGITENLKQNANNDPKLSLYYRMRVKIAFSNLVRQRMYSTF